MKQVIPFVIILALIACSSEEESMSDRFVPARPVSDIVSDTVTGTFESAFEVAQTPIVDLGLKRQPIPPHLQVIVANPYALPNPISCAALLNEITILDEVLGPDACTPDNPSGVPKSRKGEYVEEGSGMIRDKAVDQVGGMVNVVPLRGLVRRASGADKHAKAVTRAYEAGKLRRAFLKGMVASYKCQPSAK